VPAKKIGHSLKTTANKLSSYPNRYCKNSYGGRATICAASKGTIGSTEMLPPGLRHPKSWAISTLRRRRNVGESDEDEMEDYQSSVRSI
jgi:hypothetical protein